VIVVVMGVSGSGKTTVARAIADRRGWPMQEGDALHPPENVARMQAGTALTDADRWPWLRLVAAWIDARCAAGENGVITCSLLKRAYRDLVIGDRPDVALLYLHGSRERIAAHMAQRSGHFMPLSLLDSQFATLEEPAPEEHAMIVEITDSIDETVAQALSLMVRAEGRR
jgi:carbohydrate kinase (thermoresistant glucokinase family)